MTTIRTRTSVGLAILAATAIVSLGSVSASAEMLRPTQAASAPNGFPAARCSRPAEEEALRIKQLAEFVQKSRAMVEQNPMMSLAAAFVMGYLPAAMTRR